MSNLLAKDIETIFKPEFIRAQAQKIYDSALDRKTHFNVHLDQLESCADFVVATIKENYPDLNIPFHSRWRHFGVGGINREAFLNKKLETLGPVEKARAKLDLAIVSVLLDAGAGMEWSFTDVNGQKYSKSEGLAIASYNMFIKGAFSKDPKNPLRVDAEKLILLTDQDIATGFQVSPSNPLVGISGRTQILNNLGKVLKENKNYFPGNDSRPGNIIDYLNEISNFKTIEAKDILTAVLYGMGNMWPSRIMIDNQNLGDVWHYSNFAVNPTIDSLIPFHKLSQWLSYSLIEPIEESGLKVKNLNAMTGLPEYRNGGLFIDMGVLTLRNPLDLEKAHTPDSLLIIEWRALTVVLLDKIADLVRKKLNKSSDEFPLVKILEGGTWWAGRKIAKAKRADGGPPLKIESDGTVF